MTLSLRQRLTLTHAAAMALAVISVGLAEHRWHSREVYERLDSELTAVAAAQAASAIDGEERRPHLHAMVPVRGELPPKVALIDPQGHAYPLSAPELTGEPVRRLPDGFASVTIGGAPWRLYRQSLQVRGDRYALIVGQSLAPLVVAERRQWFLSVGWLVFGLVLAAILGAWLADRAYRPLRELAERAKRIGPDAITERLPVPDTGDELAVLADSLNRMLSRLETAFTAQRRFVNDAAHEVRTPLAALRTNLEVVSRRKREPAEYEEAIADALAEINRLTQLVNQLLMLERSQTDRSDGPTPVGPLVAAAIQRFQSLAAQTGVRLACDGDGTARIAPGGLAQVLDNLLSNAIRYSPAGGLVRVTVQQGHGELALDVADEGPGIPLDQREAVFDRFYRVDPARHHTTGGAGLGLAICRAIVTAHGGRIGVVPSETGTVVRVELPA